MTAAWLPRLRPHPEVDVIFLGAALLYVWAIERLGPTLAPRGRPVVTRRQRRFYFSGVALLWIFSEWPIHDISEGYLLSVHMVQHAVFSLMAPPLLLFGMPDWMVSWAASLPVLRWMARNLARPVPALAWWSAMTLITHLPPVIDHELSGVSGNEPFHFTMHLLLFASALCLWFPVINRVPGLPQLGDGARVLYLLASTITTIVPTMFIGLATKPIYPAYAAKPRLWGLSVVADQELGAGLMWLLHTVVMMVAVGVAFFSWWGRESAADRRALEEIIDLRDAVPAGPSAACGIPAATASHLSG